MPPDGHTRKQPTAPTLTTSLTREICRTCADRAHRRAPRTRREEPTTEVHAATRAPLDDIIVAKQKPAPRHSKPRGEDAAIYGEDAAIHQSPSRSRLRDDAPKEEKDAKTPPSPDPADLRFPSGAKAAGRGEEHHTAATLPRKSATLQAPPMSDPAKAGERISPGKARPTTACTVRPRTAAHQSPQGTEGRASRPRPHPLRPSCATTRPATAALPEPGRARRYRTNKFFITGSHWTL